MNESTTPSRVWLITGCSSGFGLALVSALLSREQRVIATARQPGSLAELAARYPETCRTLTLDVTDAAQVKAAVAEGAAAFGRPDVVVNNAGYGLIGAFEELGTEQIARNFSVNLFGALEVIRAVLPILRAQGSGHIVNISAAVISNYAGFSIYGATKWALEGVSESLAAVESSTPPLRLVLGKYANGKVRKNFADAEKERAAWEHIGWPTDSIATL